MSKNTYLIFSLIAILFGTVMNYSRVNTDGSSSRSYGGSTGGSSSSGWHK